MLNGLFRPEREITSGFLNGGCQNNQGEQQKHRKNGDQCHFAGRWSEQVSDEVEDLAHISLSVGLYCLSFECAM